ncbi:unnamed protein product, partial [Brenthis ino]
MWFLVISLCFVSSISCGVIRESRLVQLSQGPVRGYKDVEYGIFVFHSIPYATAPTGRDKFKVPSSPPKWSEPLEAVDGDVICPQIDFMNVVPDNKIPKEDCLLVNIYAPDSKKTQLPVVVYVHGGAFIEGWSDLFSPKGLVKTGEVIAITFNYRLSAPGFLCLGTNNIPGNAGMKDQVALLRWVKENIKNFGGNPNDVILSGFSSGASAVDLLMISKMTKGLFHKVIPDSGSSLASFAVQPDPLKNAKEYAKLLNFNDVDNLIALEEFYRNIPYEQLLSVPVLNRTDSMFLMSPCVERDLGEERFLEDNPVNILKSGNFTKYPTLVGFSNMEGLFFIQMFEYWKNMMNTRFSDFLPGDLHFQDDKEKEEVAEQVKKFYFKNKLVGKDTITAYVDYLSDVVFVNSLLKSVKLQVEAGNSQMYFYEYSYIEKSIPPIPYTNIRGAIHCSQTFAILDGFFNGTMVPEIYISEELKEIKKSMRKIWLSFITTGCCLKMWECVLVSMCFIAASAGWSEDTNSKLVNITQGPVRGYKDPNEDITVFYSIPYAKAPTGPDKFKAPLRVPTWTDPLEAVDQKIVCPQNISPFVQRTFQEDCLIANVYVPNTEEQNLPVVVYIHGGGFVIGYGDLFKPKKLVASKKVVAVTFNYRLGAHGFLCLGTKDIPGNAGMKDQVALLRWVKQNIASFGGNPDDITISGFSAGSSSVGLLMISKMAQGLFKKGIPESGDIFSPYSMQTKPVQVAKEYAQLINFNNVDDINALETFFKNVSYEVMTSADILSRADSTFLFAPCVERDFGQERFLDNSPMDIINRGEFKKIPLLSGFTSMEGLMRISNFDQWKIEMNKKFSNFLPADLYFKNNEERDKVAQTIKQFYFNNQPVDNNNVLDYVNLLSDMLFTCPTLRSTKLLLKSGNEHIYFYEYTHVDNCTAKVPYTDVRGPTHVAQTSTILEEDLRNCTDDKDIEEWKSLMREIWLNFITEGIPESPSLPEWPPLRADSFNYMDLNRNPSLKTSLLQERCSFWEEIYNKFYQNPLPPEY